MLLFSLTLEICHCSNKYKQFQIQTEVLKAIFKFLNFKAIYKIAWNYNTNRNDMKENPLLHENNCNYNSYRCSCKFAFIFFLSFLTNRKQESGFQQVGSLVTRNIYVFFIASRTLLQSYAEFNRLSYRNFSTCYHKGATILMSSSFFR